MPTRFARGLMLLGVVAALAGPAHAGTLSLLIENDAFDRTDGHYTSGVKFDYLTSPMTSDPIRGFVRQYWPGGEDVALQSHFSIGQSIFTPRNTKVTTPLPTDRPYAGWLYGTYGIVARTPAHVTNVDIDMGVVGPSAGGKWSQNNVHKWLGQHGADGWANQLPDQFGFDLSVERDWRLLSFNLPLSTQIDVRPHLGATVGNVLDEAFAGATVRIGSELGADDLPLRVRPGYGGSGGFSETSGLGWFLFAGASAQGVAYNLFIDGDPPYASSLSHRPLVLDLQWGAAIRVYRFQVTYAMIYRSKEFYGQKGDDRFGTLNFSWHF